MLVWYDRTGKIVGTGIDVPTTGSNINSCEVDDETWAPFATNPVKLAGYKIVIDPVYGAQLREQLSFSKAMLEGSYKFDKLKPRFFDNALIRVCNRGPEIEFMIDPLTAPNLAEEELELQLVFFMCRKGNANDLIKTVKFQIKELPLSVNVPRACEVYTTLILDYNYVELPSYLHKVQHSSVPTSPFVIWRDKDAVDIVLDESIRQLTALERDEYYTVFLTSRGGDFVTQTSRFKPAQLPITIKSDVPFDLYTLHIINSSYLKTGEVYAKNTRIEFGPSVSVV
jgi:hypothetical protein